MCGAPNARTGMKGVFAPPGAFIPGKNMTLGVGTIRGVESRGMLVSEMELQLSDDHEGIIDLPEDAPVGQPYATYAGLDDPVIEINLTPNRPDCTSVHGIARDLAAAGLGKLKGDAVQPVKGAGACPVSVTLAFEAGDEHLCPAFALRLVRGVRNGASPAWMQRRLAAIGLRPINALVDITNYVTFDRGRPLHVFDAAKVKGDLTVRRARNGEEIVALDGRTYTLDDSIVVIADADGPESIAGIMGGEHSGCDATTTDVLIESALWDPLNIAQSGRRLGIQHRCALPLRARRRSGLHGAGPRSRDPHGARALRRRGVRASRRGRDPRHRPHHRLPLDRGAAPLGPRCAAPGIEGHPREPRLPRCGHRRPREGAAAVMAPGHRGQGRPRRGGDPHRRARPHRAEAAAARGGGGGAPVLTPIQKRTRLAKRLLAARGLVEAVTWSFIAKAEAKLFGGGDKRLALANPIASDLSDMRPSLLPGLLKAAQRNADRCFGDVALFEVGQCFASDEPEGQTIKAAAVRRGTARAEGVGRHWDGGAIAVDAFDAKADAMALLTALGVPTAGVQVVPGGPDWFHPGRSATLQFGPKNKIGAFGEIHPKILRALDVKGPLVAFEITLDALPPPKYRADQDEAEAGALPSSSR